MKYAPILIPTLCRSSHFIRLVESLKRNAWAQYTDLYIALDYSPLEKYQKGRNEIIQYLENRDFSAFKAVHVVKRERNFGAIDNGDSLVQMVFEKYDSLILLPDDIDVSPNFIEYMDKCLDRYENDNEVIAVCGYSYPIDWKVSIGATCLKQNVNCAVWGVGYWKDKYNTILEELKNGDILADFPKVIRNKSYLNMIDACSREYIEAACYKWCYGRQWMFKMTDIALRAYLAVKGKYAISPVVSKVKNYGFDGSGEFCDFVEETSYGAQTARTYDYVSQPIDDASGFELIEDSLCDTLSNCKLLNSFDYRAPDETLKSRKLLWLSNNIGIWAAKLYCLVGLPYDFVVRVYNKYLKK